MNHVIATCMSLPILLLLQFGNGPITKHLASFLLGVQIMAFLNQILA